MQCSPDTNHRASAQPTCMGVGAAEHDVMLVSNCKVWELSPTLEVWNSSVGFVRFWPLQLQ